MCRGNREKEKERESADDTEEIRYEKNEKDINWKIRERNIQNDLEISIQTEKHVILRVKSRRCRILFFLYTYKYRCMFRVRNCYAVATKIICTSLF